MKNMAKKIDPNNIIPFTDAQLDYIKSLERTVKQLLKKDKDKSARLRNIETFLDGQTYKTLQFLKVDLDFIDEVYE